MKKLAAVRRFPEGATRDVRKLFGEVLLATLDQVGVKPGEKFFVAHPSAVEGGRLFDPMDTARHPNFPAPGSGPRRAVVEIVARASARGATAKEVAQAAQLEDLTATEILAGHVKEHWLTFSGTAYYVTSAALKQLEL